MNPKDIETFRQRFEDNTLKHLFYLTDKINEGESNYRNFIITISTLLFTFTVPIFTTHESLKHLSHEIKNLLILSWLLLFCSVVLSIIHVYKDRIFYKYKIDKNSEVLKIVMNDLPWNELIFSQKILEIKNLYLNDITSVGSNILVSQAILVTLSFLFIIYCVIDVYFY